MNREEGRKMTERETGTGKWFNEIRGQGRISRSTGKGEVLHPREKWRRNSCIATFEEERKRK
jgi:hypothetical protein